METQLQYKLDVFEGPLDLLLSLIAKNKIDIYDIKISELLDQYMEQIAQMQENQMDIASEFLTMASRLVYIKSVMLLPKYEEEAEELKKELTGQLLEYAVCREIAAKLGTIYDFDTYCKDPSPVEFDMTYNRLHPSSDIVKGYISAVGRGKRRLPPSEQAFSGIVAHKIVSVNSFFCDFELFNDFKNFDIIFFIACISLFYKSTLNNFFAAIVIKNIFV